MLLSSKDTQTRNGSLTTVLRGFDICDFARAAFDHNVAVLVQSRALLAKGERSAGIIALECNVLQRKRDRLAMSYLMIARDRSNVEGALIEEAEALQWLRFKERWQDSPHQT